jgi:hypothetical protein
MKCDAKGLYGLRFDDEELLQYQFRVVGRSGSDYLVQYFSFRDDSPGPIVCVKKKDLFDTRHVEFYFNESEWQDACADYRPRPIGADKPADFDYWVRVRDWVFEPKARCLHWLMHGNWCRGCGDGLGSRPWMDHISGYISDRGKRILLCQPQELYDFDSLTAACKQFDLQAVVHGDGWYGYATICIELRNR